MPRILILIFFSCFIVSVYAQTRPWQSYRIKGPFVNTVQRSKGKVMIHSVITNIDTVRENGQTFYREIETKETKTYYSDGKVIIDKVVNGKIDNHRDQTSIPLVLSIPGVTPPDTSNFARSQLSTPGAPDSIVYQFSKDTISLTKKQLRIIFEHNYFIKHRSVRFYIGLNFSPSIATHMVLVNQPQFSDQTSLQTRNENERSIFGYAFSVPVGIALSKRASLYAEYIHLKQGFKSNNTGVDWQTGLPIPATGINTKETYRFHSNGVGLGYTNSGYTRAFNCIMDIGLYYTWLSYFKDRANNSVGYNDIKSNPVTANLNRSAFIGKLGIGINYRISTAFELHWLPTLYYNFTPINSAMLKTRLYNLGFTTGIGYRFVSKN